MTRSWTFTVPGQPVPKGRPRTVSRDGKSHTYTPKRTKAYELLAGAALVYWAWG